MSIGSRSPRNRTICFWGGAYGVPFTMAVPTAVIPSDFSAHCGCMLRSRNSTGSSVVLPNGV